VGNRLAAVAEGNYGRAQQRRYTDANAQELMDEQPGALPEILFSPEARRNIDRCWTCRAMFMQAWGHYGTAWPVIHQQLGVRPRLGEGRLDVVPDVPDGQTRIAGENIRLGDRSVSVVATHSSTTVTSRVKHVRIGVTVARKPRTVELDGRPAKATFTPTPRGLEVTVRASAGRHTVTVG
jgi:hypothetical protein